MLPRSENWTAVQSLYFMAAHSGTYLEAGYLEFCGFHGNITFALFSARWFENLKLILSGVTRPTRRGTVFKNLRPRKLPLSRHYRKVHLNLSLHTFQIHYWMSFAMQRGFELTGESIGFSSGMLSIYLYCTNSERCRELINLAWMIQVHALLDNS